MTSSYGRYFDNSDWSSYSQLLNGYYRPGVGVETTVKINFKRLIKKVEFYPPAVKMTFTDGKVVVASAKDGDEYDPEYGMMVCVLKYLWNGSGYLGEFKKWIKKAEEEKKAKEDKIKSEKETKEREAKKRAKNQERLAKRKAAQKEEAIEIQKEAYKRALQELKETEGITKEVK